MRRPLCPKTFSVRHGGVGHARWKHPFTCVVAGPSGSGKSTFVRHLMLSQEKIIDAQFDYIYIFIGTDASENKILSRLLTDIPLQ